MILQADPKAGYLAHKAEIDAAVAKVLASGWYILGEEVKGFEAEFAKFVGVGHGIGVANGTDALEIALRALGVGPGDKVATVSHTAVATVAAIELVGAEPVLLDVDPDRYTMDADELAEVLKREPIKAVIPVHLYGQPAALDRIMQLCDAARVPVIEDCSQAHGAMLGNRQVGAFGRVACYSLYPTKNLGAFGDGGIVVTDDADLAKRIRELREYGWRERYISATTGMNTRLDELHAAMLRVRLRHLPADNERRRAIAAIYDKELRHIGKPLVWPGVTHVYHQYVVRHVHRDKLRARLKAMGVGTNIHYPMPVHVQPAYAGRVALGPKACKATETLAAEVLSLPMYPELPDEQARKVVQAIHSCIQLLH
ncbi:MAG: DegT/DnrJ/EryC1/StrS family aminotransferase [Alphaproteobacteria bacterium]|nr:DegT/DnrJ/EryC1/StrS family aminotransferase [Alphaproteobacteria bacterium]